MTTTSLRTMRSPWPGPLPYEEKDAHLFFGRERDLRQLKEGMTERGLNVLTAPSGVGKSSLIRAALVPMLRAMREDDDHRFGPVLILSSWGAAVPARPALTLVNAIRTEIERIHEEPPALYGPRLGEDTAALVQVLPADDDEGASAADDWSRLEDYVKRLCDATELLVIIIDQAEELLGSGLDTPDHDLEAAVLGIVGELYRVEPRLNILVSLREEYLARLRVLDQYVDALDSRTIRLAPMPRSTAREAILEAARCSPDLSLHEEAADTVLSWVGRSRSAPDVYAAGSALMAQTSRSVDLLGLQALLSEVVQWARGNVGELGDGRLSITAPLLQQFRVSLAQGGDEVQTTALATQALQRYIERLFDRERIAEVSASHADESPDVMRSLLVRMAPWLSTPGGFKRHIAESDLVFNAVWPNLQRLGVTGEGDARSLLAKRRGAASFDIAEPRENEEGRDHRSGQARQRTWSLAETAERLVHSGFVLTEYLQETGVLKGGSAGGVRTCELVHDGIGSALTAWATKERGSFRDVCSSLVSQGGEDFHWRSPDTGDIDGVVRTIDGVVHISGMCWLSCRLDGAELRNVAFENCTLKGMLFSGCKFSNCAFNHCDLTGAMFAGCSVERPEGPGDPVGLTLDTCTASSIVFKSVALGSIRLTHSYLPFAQLLQFEEGSSLSLEVDRCDLRNALFEDVEKDWVTLKPLVDMKRRSNLIDNLPPLTD